MVECISEAVDSLRDLLGMLVRRAYLQYVGYFLLDLLLRTWRKLLRDFNNERVISVHH